MTVKNWIISEPDFEAEKSCSNFKIWPWNGHRRFAYDLIRFVNPKRFVELGTYWGTSFFAFCQAVKDFHLGTECIAIDTWKGDGHTGPYDPKALETFSRISREVFGEINIRPLELTFQEASPLIEKDSVDVLHIDGCHDYDAVKEDYLTWLPKLKTDGIVLFHDVADSVDYESVRFWKEVSNELPHMTFQHSWGLGVLFPKGSLYYNQMKRDDFDDKLKIYEYRSDLDYALVRIDILKEMVEDKKRVLTEKENLIGLLEKKSFDQQQSISSILFRCAKTMNRYLKPKQ